MKKILSILVFLAITTQLRAQSNAPVRLALISENDPAATAVDILTAQFSSNQKIQLLERDQIARVYREQGLSAGNTDYLKLGQILGADGLLLLGTSATGTNQFLNVRLVAVKPGVVLAAERFSWPMTSLTEWAPLFVKHLDVFLPKLAVLANDAIPISVVNLRSAIQSDEGKETEWQLKLLTIQRLSLERQLFVLERQRMEMLSEEKTLKSDESAFWDGSYLLEGTVDQNGYSKETITINARLTPPKGGAAVLFEVSGSRTNLAEVINQLAAKVNESLKVNSSVPAWNAADEAQQYFQEAQWALKWGIYSEAQAAADSAWALGKRDLECALVRVKSYVMEVSANVGELQTGGYSFSDVVYDNGELLNPAQIDSRRQLMVKQALASHFFGAVYKISKRPGRQDVDWVFTDTPPDSQNIDRALHALELYNEFSRTSPDGVPKILTRGKGWNDWHNSDWYLLGIDDLVAASRVLQNFNFVPESQKPVADKLAELRALARSVAELISESPSVHDSYFVGDRVAVYDELANTIGEDGGRNPNIFSCEVKWGCFWQETPEDCVALYRELMSSPVFCYVHDTFWFRPPQRPRLVAWTENDRKRLATVWDDFMRETDVSTNVFMRMEGKALKLRDANNDNEAAIAVTNFFEAFLENRCAFITNNVDVLYLNWGIDDLVKAIGGYKDEASGAIERSGSATPETEALWRFCSEFSTKLSAKDVECKECLADLHNLQAFEQQKQYLKGNKPFNPNEFVQVFMFGFKDYSKTQALEIQPLLAAYKTNLTGTWAQIGATQVGQVEANVNRILNPPGSSSQPPIQPQAPQLAAVVKTAVVPPVSNNTPKTSISEKMPEIVTNVLTVNKFLEIPLDGLQGDQISDVKITAHHWFEGKLLLDSEYSANVYSFDEKGNWKSSRGATFHFIALLDPATEHWDVIGCPEEDITSQNNYYHRSMFVHGDLFNCDGGQIRKYDLQKQQWQSLKISDGNNYELFAVNEHLYAASRDIIFEILEEGKSTRILASTRRNPPASTLDREDLGTPTLFEGPNHSLRICTSSKIFTWTGNDWHEDFAAPSTSSQPDIFMDGLLFRRAGSLNASYQNGVIFRQANGAYGFLVHQDEISCLANEANETTLCLKANQDNWSTFSRPGAKPIQVPKPFWIMPTNLLPWLPAALRQSDLYILEDQFAVHAIVNERHEILQDEPSGTNGFNSALLCFSHDLALPQRLFIKFDYPDAKMPTWMFPTTNLLFLGSENSRGIMPGVTGSMREPGVGHKAGVWIMPISQLDSAIAVQKQIQLSSMTQEKKQAVVTEIQHP